MRMLLRDVRRRRVCILNVGETVCLRQSRVEKLVLPRRLFGVNFTQFAGPFLGVVAT